MKKKLITILKKCTLKKLTNWATLEKFGAMREQMKNEIKGRRNECKMGYL